MRRGRRGGGEKGEGEERKERGRREREWEEEGRREKEERRTVPQLAHILHLCRLQTYLSWFPRDFCAHYLTLSERIQDKLF